MIARENPMRKFKKVIEQISQFSAGTLIEGQINCAGSCFFDGKIEGNIEIDNKLVLGKNCIVLGDVSTKDLIVKGDVTGSVFVENKAIFSDSSNVSIKTLSTHVLEVENGAVMSVNNMIMNLSKNIPQKFYNGHVILINDPNDVEKIKVC